MKKFSFPSLRAKRSNPESRYPRLLLWIAASAFGLLAMTVPMFARASNPGDACSTAGAVERDGGQTLICNGTNWKEAGKIANTGRTLMQIDNDTGSCTADKTGRLRYDENAVLWCYCSGSAWLPFGMTAPPSDTGLIAHWKFDETSGTSAANAAGGGLTGTLQNFTVPAAWVAGKIGGGLDFDGTNDRVSLGTSSALNISGTMTITAWIKPDTFGADGAGAILFRASGGNGFQFSIAASNNGLVLWNGSTLLYSSSNTVTLGQWQHVAAVMSGGAAYFYMNGVLLTSGILPLVGAGTSVNAYLGMDSISNGEHFDGVMDDVRVYSRALSAQEIQGLYVYTGGISSNPC